VFGDVWKCNMAFCWIVWGFVEVYFFSGLWMLHMVPGCRLSSFVVPYGSLRVSLFSVLQVSSFAIWPFLRVVTLKDL
jgi:hypothetical protein